MRIDHKMAGTKGFTLIEIAIILVVVGLIVAAFIGGEKVLHAAKIRSVVLDVSKIRTAVSLFQDKYEMLPGDFNEAASYWSECVDHNVNPCNGNGDGVIKMANDVGQYEPFRAFQHMSLADMIDGYYTAKYSDPKDLRWYRSKIDNSHFVLIKNYIQLANHLSGTTDDFYASCSLSAVDAYSIDKKIDDGLASSGSMTGQERGTGALDCSTSCLSGGDYNKENSEIGCVIHFEFNK